MSVQKMLIAVDVDGTLFDGRDVADEAVQALSRARADGHRLVIVTGRRWEGLDLVVPAVVALADCVVCEEGGVIVNVHTGQLALLDEPVEPELITALIEAGVPALDIGHVVIGAPTASLPVVTEVRDRLGSNRIIITNKGSIALAPPAHVTKAPDCGRPSPNFSCTAFRSWPSAMPPTTCRCSSCDDRRRRR